MNILGLLLYLKALLYLLLPVAVDSYAPLGRLCGKQLADMLKYVCEGRGYYGGETDSPILSERQAKAFVNGRKRTGKIVTECCHNHCNVQIIESYCAPLHVHPGAGSRSPIVLTEREQELVNEQNNVVDVPPPLPHQPQGKLVHDVAVPQITQEIVDTLSDQLEDSIESETNLLADAMPALMLADEVRENSEQVLHTGNDEGNIPKEKGDNVVTDMTELLETQTALLDEEVERSDNVDRSHLHNKTKGNSRTNRPSSRERPSRRKNSREKKKHKAKSAASRERKARRRNKSKNKKNRRRKSKHEHDDYTPPTDQLITGSEVVHPRIHIIHAEPPSRSVPANLDADAADAGSRSERSFLTTITAKLLDVMGLQQTSNTKVR